MTNCACAGGCAGSNYPFLTSKERDNETGVDYFIARYYSSSQGRFTSADSFAGARSNPQSLNLYAYSLNDPVDLIDPSGHFPVSRNTENGVRINASPWIEEPELFQMRWSLQSQGPPQKPLPPTTEGGPLGTPINNPCIIGNPGCNPVDLGTVDVVEHYAIPGRPNDSPGETTLERYASAPVETALQVADWASKGFRRFGYAVTPDYFYVNAGIPLVASGSLQFSKDWHLYWSLVGPTGGVKNFKFGWQTGVAYFVTSDMSERDRHESIMGPGTNLSTPFTPLGAYIPDSGTPAITLGGPFGAGFNRSRTWQIF